MEGYEVHFLAMVHPGSGITLTPTAPMDNRIAG